MALTIADANTRSQDVWGRQKVRIVDVTFDSSYDADGEVLTPASVGLAEIIGVAVIGRPEGKDVQYDHVTGKLIVTVGDVEVAGASNQSTLVARLAVIGI